jgi:hypothetical protein
MANGQELARLAFVAPFDSYRHSVKLEAQRVNLFTKSQSQIGEARNHQAWLHAEKQCNRFLPARETRQPYLPLWR